MCNHVLSCDSCIIVLSSRSWWNSRYLHRKLIGIPSDLSWSTRSDKARRLGYNLLVYEAPKNETSVQFKNYSNPFNESVLPSPDVLFYELVQRKMQLTFSDKKLSARLPDSVFHLFLIPFPFDVFNAIRVRFSSCPSFPLTLAFTAHTRSCFQTCCQIISYKGYVFPSIHPCTRVQLPLIFFYH